MNPQVGSIVQYRDHDGHIRGGMVVRMSPAIAINFWTGLTNNETGVEAPALDENLSVNNTFRVIAGGA